METVAAIFVLLAIALAVCLLTIDGAPESH